MAFMLYVEDIIIYRTLMARSMTYLQRAVN